VPQTLCHVDLRVVVVRIYGNGRLEQAPGCNLKLFLPVQTLLQGLDNDEIASKPTVNSSAQVE
jgi:hypothetical protein